MKKNILFLAAIILGGIVTLTISDLRAQIQPAPGASPVQQFPPPGRRPIPPRARMAGLYRQSVRMLNMVKADLQRSKDDYNGHRQSAIDACAKAVQELQAVEEIMTADAAKNAAQQNPPPGSTSAPAPAPATQPAH